MSQNGPAAPHPEPQQGLRRTPRGPGGLSYIINPRVYLVPPEAPDKPRKPKKHHKAFENRDIPAATTQGLGQEHARAPDRMLQPKTKSSLNVQGTVENHTPVRKPSSWY